MQAKKAISTSAESATRVVQDSTRVADSLDTAPVARQVQNVTKPSSARRTMRKAGVALIAAPDPVTTVAGIGLLASSYAVRKDPANLESLALETRKLLRDLRSLSL